LDELQRIRRASSSQRRRVAWGGTVYYRLHGSPRKYWSRYPRQRITQWAADLQRVEAGSEAWCIFDNTASGAAIENALEMLGLTAR